jgi:hypothetical protein
MDDTSCDGIGVYTSHPVKMNAVPASHPTHWPVNERDVALPRVVRPPGGFDVL